MKKWKVLHELKIENGELKVEKLVDLLLENRGISTKEERENFLFPKLEDVTPKNVGIDAKQLKKALTRIKKAIKEKEQIVVFGDYDVDGITGSAILWETLYALGATVIPYIPHRVDEGYGLSTIGISNIQDKISNIQLIITVDNGIVANDAVDFANEQGIDVIVTDHHTIGEALPKAHAIVHTTKLCGAGIAYLLSQELNKFVIPAKAGIHKDTGSRIKSGMTNDEEDTHLELATLGTVADLVPLTGANRTIVKHGLEKVTKTQRPGLKELYKQAGITKDIFTVYEIGYIIGPRLNAAGRIESAMDSLRLLCTNDPKRGLMLAEKLELTNRERQLLLRQSALHAVSEIRNRNTAVGNLLIIANEEYNEGIIGLVAGKLVEEFYRPSIVIAKGEKRSKASARSITGFNIIEFLRGHKEHFVNVGGHPMAAGFTIDTEKIIILQEALENTAAGLLTEDMLQRTLKIDCELPLSAINTDLYQKIQELAPFGMGNPEPVFVSRDVSVSDIRVIGKEGNHLKLRLQQTDSQLLDAIAFGMGELAGEVHKGDTIDIAYTIDENTWNGNTTLQLKIKDIKVLKEQKR